MPFEVIDSLDPLTKLVEFKTSPVYELVLGIRTLLDPMRRHQAWAERATSHIPRKLLTELKALYQEVSDGSMYLELPVDYPDHDDAPGFFRYVRDLSDADFIFYLLGRIISRDQLAGLLPHSDAVREAVSGSSQLYERYGQYLDGILVDVPAFRERLVRAWEAYWDTFFKDEIPTFDEGWKTGLYEKQSILSREGGRGLMEKVTGRSDLPPELPPGVPVTTITYIPVFLLPSRVYRFFGYGNITVLFDPHYTEARTIALEQAKDEAAATIRALDDESRLKILRLIAQQSTNLHGKVIAERLGISASAVSRHLALLKDGNLIIEEKHKNLITYRFQKEALGELVNKLLDYLGS